MARQRFIHPDIWEHEGFGLLSDAERLLFIAIFSNADDEGRLVGHPANLRSIAFRYDDRTLADVRTMRDHIAQVMRCVLLYEVDGREYIQLTSWQERQHPRYPQPSVLPPCPKTMDAPLTQDSGNDDATVRQPCAVGRDGLVRDGLGDTARAREPNPGDTTSDREREAFAVLRAVPNWPDDPEADARSAESIRQDFPAVDLVKVAHDLREFYAAQPIKPKDNPRLRLRNFASKESEIVAKRRSPVALNGRSRSASPPGRLRSVHDLGYDDPDPPPRTPHD